jgi:serine/threonine protein kinase
MSLDADIHRRTTRIVRMRPDVDNRATLVSQYASCGVCASRLESDADFCVMCGERIRPRVSLVGSVIGDIYSVESQIAEGRTATIYRARCLPGGPDVAVKVLHPELARDPIAVERFRREGKCLARLRDQHTVAVYDHGEEGDTLYLVMELLHGEGLDVRIRTCGAMPWRQTLAVVRAVCTSLAEAHAHGIVHRNLEPSNIRICAGDAVKVIDFGLAKLRPRDNDEELTYSGQAVGTLAYMAPEQLAGGACDGRADLYALGLIMLELLLGRTRSYGVRRVLPDHVPGAVETLIERCLAPSPIDRVASAIELGAAIDALLAPAPIAPAPPRRRILAHTSAFELQPPRIVIHAAVEPEPRPRGVWWKAWALACVACGFGLATAVAGCT